MVKWRTSVDIIEQLVKERRKLEAERAKACAGYDRALAEIDAAMKAIKKSRGASSGRKAAKASKGKTSSIPIDEAVIEAVKNGARTPAQIHEFMENTLGVNTTINSVRTRVSRLGRDARLTRDSSGWTLPETPATQGETEPAN